MASLKKNAIIVVEDFGLGYCQTFDLVWVGRNFADGTVRILVSNVCKCPVLKTLYKNCMSQCSGAEQLLRFMRAHGLEPPPASPRFPALLSDWYRPRWMSPGSQVTNASHLPSTDNEYDLHQFFPKLYWLGPRCLIDVFRMHSWCVQCVTTQFCASRFFSTHLLHTLSLVTTRVGLQWDVFVRNRVKYW